jgi:hypothetical protein
VSPTRLRAPIQAASDVEAARYCRGCATWRPLAEFSIKNSRTQQLQSRCRACCRAASRRHYLANREAYLARNRRNTPRLKQGAARVVWDFLRQSGCATCGERDPVVLEFNHREPRAKTANISDMVRNCASAAGLMAEIAKCDVLCANCHQRHTASGRTAHFRRGLADMCGPSIPSWRQAANRRNAELVLKRLREAACVDCGQRDPLVLQFDHRPGERKARDIGWLVSSGCRASLLAEELAKCDVRCANCHRRRTAAARGWFRARG